MRFRNKGEAMTPGWKILRVAGFGAALFTALPAWAQDAAPTVDKGDTAWMMTATILVLMMILPGLALFYGGLPLAKHLLSTLTQVGAVAGLAQLIWLFWGHSVAFGPAFPGGVGNAFGAGLGKAFLLGSTPAT